MTERSAADHRAADRSAADHAGAPAERRETLPFRQNVSRGTGRATGGFTPLANGRAAR
ncbi:MULTISPECIES: hypothetical protein [Streptomyces]|uniref:hypothetical protein n=1 Tax=Streptomyces TaxID=1883 RepID=UPI00200C43CC|nr:hypothetical protein [Streptomyces sp. LRE541]UPZ27279.1 hypothetical protein MUK60_05290 [Streptomyces sp. LRE541]